MLRQRVRQAAAVIAIAALGSGSVWSRPSEMSVLVITLDTTRADHLSPYGYMNAPMPSLERLAREATVFNQALSVSPLTLPAHTSLFTGLLPPKHGVRDNADRPLAATYTTLAEVARAQGLRTAAFVGSAVLDRERGLAQGFDVYSDVGRGDRRPGSEPQRTAAQVVDQAVKWLTSDNRARFFLWAHLYDPHHPYDPPEPFRSGTGDAYGGELAFAESQIGRLLDVLDASGRRDDTIVVVVGDHGESLNEHGEEHHGIFLYESVLRVPLMIRMPGLPARRVPEVVRITDVMPTVLALAGISGPLGDGVSLVDLMTGDRHGLDLEAYAESLYPQRFGWSPLYALRDSRYKFIDAPKPELYDLDRDPFEQHNIVAERSTIAAAMKRRLDAIASKTTAEVYHASAAASPETRERLLSLGYVTGPRADAPTVGKLPDPKDCLPRLGRPMPGRCPRE